MVERKDKCIKINENTYRVRADVVPTFELKRLKNAYETSVKGIKLISDEGKSIQNFPKQHKTNGEDKNQRTNSNYKSVVRVIKNLKNNLIDDGIIDEKLMPSFFIESLVWNINDTYFYGTLNRKMILNVLEKLKSDMDNESIAIEYSEINNLIWLFKGQDRRSPQQASEFLTIAIKEFK
ncbi:MAG: hypothetical protein KAI16_00735 [Candidatus Pacebacteria bacterium]|nr:hypothetical protein [Candidatus Paceibacterota bacterium]